MAALANNTLASPGTPFYAPAGESAKNWYQFPALNGTVLLADSAGIQTLQAIGNDLFYNGELLAKAGDIQDIAAWSDYPAINNVNMDGFSLQDVSGLTVNNGATMGTLLVANGITSEANLITPTLQIAGAAIPSLGQITTATLAASGLIQAGSISSSGSISGTAVSGTSLATSGGLDMTNTAITRASSLAISNAGAAPYGALSSPDGVMLTWNGQSITTGAAGNVSQWANYPAVAPINANSNNITNAGTVNATGITVGNGSSGILLANRLSSLAGSSDPGMSITAYQGLSVTSDAGNILTTAGAVSGTGNISTTAKGNITDTAYGEIHNITNNFEVTADGGLNPITTPNINLVAQNGNGGQINISANPGSIAALGGKINITANGGTVVLPTDPPTSVTVGGEIDIFANTGSGGLYTLTSAVKIAAAGVNSYAGAIPPVGSLAGYNFIYGTTGVSICAGLPSSGFQLPGTTYLYGLGSPGFTGVRLQSPNGIGLLSDTYATNLYPLDGNNLTIQGRSAPSANVTILDCDSLTMTGTGAGILTDKLNSVSGNSILVLDSLRANGTTQGLYTNFLKPNQATAPGVPNLTISGNGFGGNANYVNLANVNTLSFDSTGTGAITNLQSINGAVWPPPTGDASLWSQYPATSVIDVSGYGLTGVGAIAGLTSINGVPYAPTSAADWSLYPATQAVDISNQELLNVNNIGFLDNGTIIGAGQISVLASGNLTLASDNSGNVNIGTGNKGDINILTSGTGNDVIIGGDTVRLTGTVAVDVNSTLNMTGNKIINVAEIDGVGGTTELRIQNTGTGGTAIFDLSGGIFMASQYAPVTIAGGSRLVLESNTGNITIDPQALGGTIQMLGDTNIGVAGSPQNLVVTGNSRATADVVSNFGGSTPYSLNTIGALVNGNQQYNYWVAVNGSDSTGTGSVLRPFASISAALTATVGITDTIPINICIAAGTYTENPTITRNNTFLQGSVGISDAVIIGTLTFNSASTTTVSQGMSGISVVGNVICSENTSSDVSWYIQNSNVTSYGAVAVSCTSTGAGNNNLVLQNTVVIQNTTANSAINMASSRLNLIQSQVTNNTTGSAISVSGNGSLSLFGATLTCAGGATASAIISYITTVAAGVANSFNVCTFTYTAGTVGAGKTAIFFNNSNAISGSTTFNNNVFNIPGSSSLFLKPGTGAIAIVFGSNTTNITTLPAPSATLTYAYTPSTTLRANSLQDAAASAGTGSQVLTAGSAGGSLAWSSLGASSLGALGQTATGRAYLNQLVMFDTSNNALTYDSQAYSVVVQATSATPIVLLSTARGKTYILTGTTTQNFVTSTLTANDVGYFVIVKNGNASLGGNITITGATGNLTVFGATATQNGGQVILYWTGTALVSY
jgi:hypothetical protein